MIGWIHAEVLVLIVVGVVVGVLTLAMCIIAFVGRQVGEHRR